MRELFTYTMPLVVLAIMAFAIYYVSKRLAWVFSLNLTLTTVAVATTMVFCMTAMVMIMRGNYTSGISHIISNTSNIMLGIMMFLVCYMLLVDLIHLVAKFQPLTFGAIVLTLTLATTAYSLYNARNTQVIHQDIDIPNMEKPMRIAQLSDIHLGHYWGKRTLNRIVNQVVAENVDAVVITGDMFDGRVRINQDVLSPFQKITVPIYFVEGNHDGYSGVSDIKRLLSANGIQVLSNQKVEINGLQIVGLDYLMPDKESIDGFHGSLSDVTMQSELPTLNIDKNRPSILLHHNPVGVNYAAENGINLYLAGHTHAGQLFPATLFAAAMFEYNKGLYQYNDHTQVYVSQGSGTFGPPMRLGTESEITILNLK